MSILPKLYKSYSDTNYNSKYFVCKIKQIFLYFRYDCVVFLSSSDDMVSYLQKYPENIHATRRFWSDYDNQEQHDSALLFLFSSSRYNAKFIYNEPIHGLTLAHDSDESEKHSSFVDPVLIQPYIKNVIAARFIYANIVLHNFRFCLDNLVEQQHVNHKILDMLILNVNRIDALCDDSDGFSKFLTLLKNISILSDDHKSLWVKTDLVAPEPFLSIANISPQFKSELILILCKEVFVKFSLIEKN